jgi:hypothetical protein
MRSFEEILETSPERPPFSNSSSWDYWSYDWCSRCINDINDDCPLITAAFLGYTPREWTEVGLKDYECAEFQPRKDLE